jgi:hypothetical protein
MVLAGEMPENLLVARRLARRSLPGLIAWPQAERVYLGPVRLSRLGDRHTPAVVGLGGSARRTARRGLQLPQLEALRAAAHAEGEIVER